MNCNHHGLAAAVAQPVVLFIGMNMTADEFEFLIAKTEAINSDIKSDPTPKIKDVMMSSLRNGDGDNDDSSDNDDW